ncbi:TolC family protein [Solimonas marina]|uniref:TolC family protein n=1 Tax=Solimonas marina TaxID=2714601 RepID=A0A970B8J1_9GAMM|nr:TolC family protein [Solimonas marina]NKF22329.1 TolC family protein [Solimonas marina]
MRAALGLGLLLLAPIAHAEEAPAADAPTVRVVPLTQARDDTRLQAYLNQALAANPALDARNADVQASDADLLAARAQQWPQLSLNARYTHADGGRTIDIPTGQLLNPVYDTLNQYLEERGEPPQFPNISDQRIKFLRSHEQETKLTLNAPLIDVSLWANVDAKRALAGASRADREAYARSLVRELKRAYYGAVEAQAAVGILEASLAVLVENVRVSQALVDAGKATRDRVLRAEAERLDTVQQLDAARARAAQSKRLLNMLRAQPDDAPLELPTPAELPLPPSRDDDDIRTRPELRALDDNLLASQASERAARGASLPTLGIAADYGIQGEEYHFNDDAQFDTVSLVLRWQLWDAGTRRAQRRSARAQSAGLLSQREDLQRRLVLARRAAREDLDTARRAIDTGRARLEAAEEGFRIAERKRDAAALSQIEFLDAERTLREARLQLAINRCDALDRAAELELANASYALPATLTAP